MIKYLTLALILAAWVSCSSAKMMPIGNNEEPEQINTLQQDVAAAKETCEKLKVLYETGLNEENRKARELYLGKGSITLTKDPILEKSFDPNVYKPKSEDYFPFHSIYKYAELVDLYDLDEMPVEVTAQEYQALKELEWSRYYLKMCENINLAFDN